MPADIQTPMMRQYWSIKKSHPDSLLFYRMGDFYELFFDDARRASDTLKITLTTRGKHHGEDVPMCGVPVHSADDYLLKLIRAGHRVAVCEQTEDPEEARKRGKNSVVRREVVRVVTPGTLTEDSLLDAQRNNFLAAWIEIREDSAFSWLDLSTGEFPRFRMPPERSDRCRLPGSAARAAAAGPNLRRPGNRQQRPGKKARPRLRSVRRVSTATRHTPDSNAPSGLPPSNPMAISHDPRSRPWEPLSITWK